MAVQYMIVCLWDFFVAPIFFAIFNDANHLPPVVWTSLTLQGGGLYHLAMGAILGIAAWTRGSLQIEQMKSITSQ